MSESAPKLQAWGQLKPNAVYIKRSVDHEVEHWISTGNRCIVTASRQAGKSSLRARLAQDLRKNHDFLVFSIDLSSCIGVDRDWFQTLFRLIWSQLETPSGGNAFKSLDTFLDEQPEDNWQRIWCSLIVELANWGQAKKGLALLFDEVESALERPAFFAGLRAAHDELWDRQGHRFSFALFGVFVTSGQLLSDGLQLMLSLPDIKYAHLAPFERNEMPGFLAALSGVVKSPLDPSKVLDSIYDWTSGQPYLTHRILYELSRRKDPKEKTERELIDKLVDQYFLQKNRVDADHLEEVKLRIKDDQKTQAGLGRIEAVLRLYKQIQSPSEQNQEDRHRVHQASETIDISYERSDEHQQELLLLGICRVHANRLVPANRITQTIFDYAWVEQTLKSLWFEQSYQKWVQSGQLPDKRKEGNLLSGEGLQTARGWLTVPGSLSQAERDYILRSQQAQDRKELRGHYAFISLAVSIVILLTSVVSVLYYIYKSARKQTITELQLEAKQIKPGQTPDTKTLVAMLSVVQSTSETLRTENDKLKQEVQSTECGARLTSQKNTCEAAKEALTTQMVKLKNQIDLIRSSEAEKENLRRKIDALPDRGLKTPLHFFHQNEMVSAAVLDSNGTRLFAGVSTGKVYFWDTTNDGHTKSDSCGDSAVTALAVSKNDSLIAFGNKAGNICVFNSTGNRIDVPNAAHKMKVNALGFSSDGKLLISGSDDMTMKLWEISSGKVLGTVNRPNSVSAVAISENGRDLLVGDSGKQVHRVSWTSSTGPLSPLSTLQEAHNDTISLLWLDDKATRTLVGTRGGGLYEWSMNATEPTKSVRKQLNASPAPNGTPDSKHEVLDVTDFLGDFYTLIIDGNGVTRIWKTSAGSTSLAMALVNPRPQQDDKIWQPKKDTTARFSRDGNYVVTGSEDGYARLWRIRTQP